MAPLRVSVGISICLSLFSALGPVVIHFCTLFLCVCFFLFGHAPSTRFIIAYLDAFVRYNVIFCVWGFTVGVFGLGGTLRGLFGSVFSVLSCCYLVRIVLPNQSLRLVWALLLCLSWDCGCCRANVRRCFYLPFFLCLR